MKKRTQPLRGKRPDNSEACWVNSRQATPQGHRSELMKCLSVRATHHIKLGWHLS